jgi:response regulator RpfG family c-di-GMP phosphodiesterase
VAAAGPGAGLKPSVLCVDDEPQMLNALALNFGRQYRLHTAASGQAGLALIDQHPELAVIVSDMRMPEMNGAAFLAQARTKLPDATRLLLTGYADAASAAAAVNEGQIFRFLTKPCSPADLKAAVDAAVRQHELITAERVLLQQTLHGSIHALTDVLALANPLLFGRATRVKQLASELAEAVQLPERWQVEVAALLTHLGLITLPAELADKVYHGTELEPAEQEMLDRTPKIADQLLGHIPRLEGVRMIIAARTRPFRLSEYVQPNAVEALAARGAQILKVALDYDSQIAAGASPDVALGTLRARSSQYDPALLEVLTASHATGTNPAEVHEVPLSALRPGMVFADEVRTTNGLLLVPAGTEVTTAFLERLRNYRAGAIKSTLRVLRSPADQEDMEKRERYV